MKKQTVIPGFDKPVMPRIKRMHVYDAGGGDCTYPAFIAVFMCHRCGYQSDWLEIANVKEARRGLPCPQCNP